MSGGTGPAPFALSGQREGILAMGAVQATGMKLATRLFGFVASTFAATTFMVLFA